MMRRKFTDAEIDQAEEMRLKGIRWIVIEKCLGYGMMGACHYRRKIGYVSSYSDEAETIAATAAWNGLGDKQSFIDGWKLRAKRERVIK